MIFEISDKDWTKVESLWNEIRSKADSTLSASVNELNTLLFQNVHQTQDVSIQTLSDLMNEIDNESKQNGKNNQQFSHQVVQFIKTPV